MATKKKPAEAPDETPETTDEPGQIRTGVDIPPAEREILSKPIDDRMAALLEDHQRMGSRPK